MNELVCVKPLLGEYVRSMSLGTSELRLFIFLTSKSIFSILGMTSTFNTSGH